MLKNAKDSCGGGAGDRHLHRAGPPRTKRRRPPRPSGWPTRCSGDEQRMLDRLLREIPRLTDAVARAEFDGEGLVRRERDRCRRHAARGGRHCQAHGAPRRRAGQAHGPPGPQGARRGACRGYGQGRCGLRVGSRHRGLRLAQRRRDHRQALRALPGRPGPGERLRAQDPEPLHHHRVASTPCRRTSRGPETTSSRSTKSAPCSPKATRDSPRRFAATSASTRTAPACCNSPSASSATPKAPFESREGAARGPLPGFL